MIIHKFPFLKAYDEWDHGYDDTEFTDYEIEEIEKRNIDEIWYFYGEGSYEGSGQLLMRKGNLYDLHDCGHCSCCGPTEKLEFFGRELDVLWKSLSNDLKKETQILFDNAKEK